MGAHRRGGFAWPARASYALVAGAVGATAALALSGASVAEADDAEVPAHLDYRAGSGCPTEDAFVALVRVRMPRVQFVGLGEEARTFHVELTATGNHPSGSLTTEGGARTEGTRRIEAATCGDVADALALMLVLAIDPRSFASSPAGPLPLADAGTPVDGGAPEAGFTEATSDATPIDAGAPDASVERAPLAVPLPEPPPESTAEAPARASHPGRFSLGSDFVVATGVAPVALLSAAPVLGWKVKTWPLLSLSLRASFVRADTGTATTRNGSARYLWDVGRLDACGLLWPDHALRVGACVRVESGVLEVAGRNIAPSQTQDSPWLAAGLLGRAEWQFFGPLALDLNAGVAVHITANQFYFAPLTQSTTVWTVPDFGFWGEAGLAAHFL